MSPRDPKEGNEAYIGFIYFFPGSPRQECVNCNTGRDVIHVIYGLSQWWWDQQCEGAECHPQQQKEPHIATPGRAQSKAGEGGGAGELISLAPTKDPVSVQILDH